MERRFDLREEEDGTWTVFDVFTGLPGIVGGFEATGFEVDEAGDLLAMLNAADLERRREAGML
ncbi:hypothetical protein FZC33_00650 [Labrys sp. KNU-23]|uniref:hypothetical protein n=1 Tax=unclassified Labrys (in: a-proteobacteria) TaxID=2688601 RepID=UPI0011EEE3D5|nr:hypothetical protein [Labrys sp. KNU-23]QEN84829.1 hypothetical protein FZC33_00650 [Labrys sp. KNU-23]